MSTETVLTDDAIHNLIVDFEIECDYGIETTPVDNIVPFSRAIEQAVLHSPEVQAMREELSDMRGTSALFAQLVESFANAADIDLDGTHIIITADGKEIATKNIRDMLDDHLAAMEQKK